MIRKTYILAVTMGMGMFSLGCQAQSNEPITTAQPAVQSPPAPASPIVVKNITGDEYLKMKAENPEIQLLDVRTPQEVAEGFIEGSVKFNVYDQDFAEKVEKNLAKSVPVIVYCKAGGRSANAANTLARKGFTQVYNITGGITAWMTEGKPTVK